MFILGVKIIENSNFDVVYSIKKDHKQKLTNSMIEHYKFPEELIELYLCTPFSEHQMKNLNFKKVMDVNTSNVFKFELKNFVQKDQKQTVSIVTTNINDEEYDRAKIEKFVQTLIHYSQYKFNYLDKFVKDQIEIE